MMKYPYHQSSESGFLSLLIRSLTFGLIALVGLQSSLAQSDPVNEEIDELDAFEVIGGFAGSLAAAAETKKSANTVIEVISAEEIGKLPDVSIADSLTRLPGVATQRTNGRSQQIVIRGLTGDFSTGLLNGREQVSTSLNRSIEYDQYPAELLNQVVVHKTADSKLVGQGLAGAVDMRTVRPLNVGKRVIAANAFYDWTQLSELTPGSKNTGYHGMISYVDQFDDGNQGIAVGFSSTSKPFQGEQYQAWGFDSPGGNLLLGGTKSYVRSSNFDRNSFMGVYEFQPNDNIHGVIDVFYSKFNEKQLLRGMEIPMAPNWTGGNTVLEPGATITDGLHTDYTLSGIQPVIRNDVFERDAEPFSIGMNLMINELGTWPINFDIGYSEVTRDDINLETWSGLGLRWQTFPGNTADTIRVQVTPGEIPTFTPTVDYSTGNGIRLTDPVGWGPDTLPGNGMYGYYKGFKAEDQLTQVQLSTRRDISSWVSGVAFGVSYTDRSKNDGENPSGWIHAPSGDPEGLPLPPQAGTTDLSYLGLGEVYAYDPLAAFDNGVFGFTQNMDGGIVANRYNISEKIYQGFVQADMDTQWGDLPVSGNLGIRLIHVEQSGQGFSANGNDLNEVNESDSYTEVAPSLNLNFFPAENTFVRLSLARQLARPRMFDMRPSRTWGYDPSKADNPNVEDSPWSGGGGNTFLRPWDSYSADLSLEQYFSEGRGYFAITGYYKDLRTFIYEQQEVADFSDYPVPGGPDPILNQGVISTPVNGDGGRIMGLEASLSLPSELINENFQGFGFVGGVAYTDSSVQPWGPDGGTAPIAGLSDWVANGTVYFERFGWSVRFSGRYRSENRQYITTFGVPNPSGDVNPNGGFSVAQPETVFDGQISYTFETDNYWNGLTLYLQAYNLNNEPLVTYRDGDQRQVINYQKYGASYSVGASYKF